MPLLDIFKKEKKGKAEEKLKQPAKAVSKKQIKKPAPKKAVVKSVELKGKSSEMASKVLMAPHITEKAAILAEGGAYVFRVATDSNKVMISQAIKEFYGVSTRKIRIVNVPSKTRFTRRRKGVRPGYKKAVVYLKKGDEIELI